MSLIPFTCRRLTEPFQPLQGWDTILGALNMIGTWLFTPVSRALEDKPGRWGWRPSPLPAPRPVHGSAWEPEPRD